MKHSVYLIFITVFTVVLAARAKNPVKIVTIGGGGVAVSVNNQMSYQQMVDQMIDYWQRQLSKVLLHKPDLILLTEACDRPSGLTTAEQFEYYKVRKDQVKDYLALVAKDNHCYIAFGTKREENGSWWNSCILLDRRGKVAGIYNKNFPTIQEMNEIMPSDEAELLLCDFGTVACAVCFDLNFDELRERYAQQKPDIILFPSMYHGGLEQSKWAYSCQAYFVCAYGFLNAPSEIRNPLGEMVASSTNYYNYAVATVNLDRKLVHLDNNWEKLTALKRKYGDLVSISDPGRIGAVMITSEHDSISADRMIDEFDIQLLDDYFNQSRAVREQKLIKAPAKDAIDEYRKHNK